MLRELPLVSSKRLMRIMLRFSDLDRRVTVLRLNFVDSGLVAEDVLLIPPKIQRIELKLDSDGEYRVYSRNLLFGIVYLNGLFEPARALNYLEAAIDEEPNNLDARAYYAEAQLRLSFDVRAKIECEYILLNNPNHTMALAVLAAIHQVNHEYAKAFALLYRLSQVLPLDKFLLAGVEITPLQQALLKPLSPLPLESVPQISESSCAICCDSQLQEQQVAVPAAAGVFRVYHRACLFQWASRSELEPASRLQITTLYALPDADVSVPAAKP